MSSSLRALLLAAVAAPALAPSLASGAEATSATDLESLVVTAARRPQAIEDVQASIQVVGRAQIDRYAGSSVTQALAQAVGVDARTSGSNSSITIRGSSSNDVLVLFDGLERTAKYGITNLNNFPVEDVERIEIVRGPMSALYGANASGGVVNIITKSPGVGPAVTFRGTWTGDDHGGRSGFALAGAFQFGDETFGHRLSFDRREANPFRFVNTSPNYDLIGVEHVSMAYTGQWKSGRGDRLRWTLERFAQKDEAPAVLAAAPPARPRPTDYTRFERETRYFGSLGFEGGIGPGNLALDAAFSTSDGSTNRSFPTVETTEYDQTTLQARWSAPFGAHEILLGGGFKRDDVDVSINSVTAKRDNWSAYIQDEWKFSDSLTVVAGVRYDDFTLFGSSMNPRGSIGWKSGSGLYARVGYGSAFRAPTSLEQFSRFTRGRFIILGSPNLVPEESETLEGAVGWRGRVGTVELAYHTSDVTNLIETFSPTVPPINGLLVTQYRNRATADLRGFELSGRLRPVSPLVVDASWEHLKATDGATGARLTGRYRNALKASATLTLGAFETTVRYRGLLGLWGSNPAIRPSPPPFASDFETIDLVVTAPLTDWAELTVGINNISDELTPINYTSTGSIEDPAGRNIFISLRTKF
ncbi:TonB-dependent receptor plug domain-containing protein [Phenylobacterium sp.]|jgi:outer membrane cobalamin receptor|uniref:TonB-dependent receptor plug domain-containing protein n=1 Tax=Phenylobacterium sp. TaxID=1871053 RepID=UPI0037C812D5